MTPTQQPEITETWFNRLTYLMFAGFYRIAYPIFCLVYLPHFWMRSKQAEKPSDVFFQRIGNYDRFQDSVQPEESRIWVHAVSVGEVMAAKEWIRRFLARTDKTRVVVTTVTPTGQRVAKDLMGPRVTVCYAPLEYSFSVHRFLNVFQPKALLLMETELWPNLIIQAFRRGLRVGILNARLSKRSAQNYRRWRTFLGAIFRRVEFILAQTAEDRERFLSLGVPEDQVHVMGNMKFDNVSLEPISNEELKSFRNQWGFSSEDRIWVAGSTHPGEEDVFLRVFQKLKKRIPHLKAILAPRHIERSKELLEKLRSLGLQAALSTDRASGSKDILILNELGILKKVYGLAELVFVGGSLIRHGGQNPIEPAALRKPILTGPHVFNFKNVYATLRQNRAVLQVLTEADLEMEAQRLLDHPEQGKVMGENAFRVVESFQGATRDQLRFVLKRFTWISSERMLYEESNEKLFSPTGGRL